MSRSERKYYPLEFSLETISGFKVAAKKGRYGNSQLLIAIYLFPVLSVSLCLVRVSLSNVTSMH